MIDGGADPRTAARHDVVGAAFVFLTLLVVSAGSLLALGGPSPDLDLGERVERAMLAQLIGSLAAIGASLAWRSRATFADRTTVLRTLVRYVAFLCIWVPLAIGCTALWSELGLPREPQDQLAYFANPASPVGFAVVALVVCIVGPVIEELIFRGHLQTGLDAILGTRLAILSAAALFGLTHVGSGWVLFVPITALGVFFGWLRHRSGGLRAVVVAHVAHNTLMVTVVSLHPQLLEAQHPS